MPYVLNVPEAEDKDTLHQQFSKAFCINSFFVLCELLKLLPLSPLTSSQAQLGCTIAAARDGREGLVIRFTVLVGFPLRFPRSLNPYPQSTKTKSLLGRRGCGRCANALRRPRRPPMFIPFHTFSYLFIPVHTFSYLFVPFHTFPYLFIPFHTLSCIFIPIHTFSYLFIPFHTFSYLFIPS